MDYVTQKIIAKKPYDILNVNQINTNYIFNSTNNYCSQTNSNNSIINYNKTIVFNS